MFPPVPLSSIINSIITLIKLGEQIREKYQIYTNADQNLIELDSRLRSSLFVMGVFENVIRRGLGALSVRQQEDIGSLVDGLHSVFDRCVLILLSFSFR